MLLIGSFMPPLPGLPHAGQVMLGILAFAVILWMTEALDYAVSAVVIGALMIVLLALSPAPGQEAAGTVMGTRAALPYALSGFSNSAVVLVDPASAPFLAGSEVDFVDDLIGASFRVNNPNATASCGCGTSFSI